MCLAVPGLIIERHEGLAGMPMAVVEFGEVRREICLACVSEAEVGDHVLAHAGMAIARIDARHAASIWATLDELGETLADANRDEP